MHDNSFQKQSFFSRIVKKVKFRSCYSLKLYGQIWYNNTTPRKNKNLWQELYFRLSLFKSKANNHKNFSCNLSICASIGLVSPRVQTSERCSWDAPVALHYLTHPLGYQSLRTYTSVLLYHIFWCRSCENEEVQNSTNCSISYHSACRNGYIYNKTMHN